MDMDEPNSFAAADRAAAPPAAAEWSEMYSLTWHSEAQEARIVDRDGVELASLPCPWGRLILMQMEVLEERGDDLAATMLLHGIVVQRDITAAVMALADGGGATVADVVRNQSRRTPLNLRLVDVPRGGPDDGGVPPVGA